jgi:hypothetical protein
LIRREKLRERLEILASAPGPGPLAASEKSEEDGEEREGLQLAARETSEDAEDGDRDGGFRRRSAASTWRSRAGGASSAQGRQRG